MRTLMLKLEPIIWLLFGGGMLIGGLLLPALILTLGVAGPLGWIDPAALSYERIHGLASSLPGRAVLLGAVTLPLWAGAHHLRHVWIDFGGLKTDGLVGPALYAIALVGSVLGVVRVLGI